MTRKDTDQTLETVYTFVRTYLSAHGYSPSLREIAAQCYLGRSTVLHYLDRLEVQGRLRREHGQARSITLTSVDSKERPETGQKVGQTSVK